jgi:hypothetical protein
MAIDLLLAAEMEVLVTGVADRPAAIAGQKREDRLTLLLRNDQVVVPESSMWGLKYGAHKTSYTNTRPAKAVDYAGERDRRVQPTDHAHDALGQGGGSRRVLAAPQYLVTGEAASKP